MLEGMNSTLTVALQHQQCRLRTEMWFSSNMYDLELDAVQVNLFFGSMSYTSRSVLAKFKHKLNAKMNIDQRKDI